MLATKLLLFTMKLSSQQQTTCRYLKSLWRFNHDSPVWKKYYKFCIGGTEGSLLIIVFHIKSSHVCSKKTKTICSFDTLLRFVLVFLKQTWFIGLYHTDKESKLFPGASNQDMPLFKICQSSIHYGMLYCKNRNENEIWNLLIVIRFACVTPHFPLLDVSIENLLIHS